MLDKKKKFIYKDIQKKYKDNNIWRQQYFTRMVSKTKID